MSDFVHVARLIFKDPVGCHPEIVVVGVNHGPSAAAPGVCPHRMAILVRSGVTPAGTKATLRRGTRG